ncbi:MAG: CHAT domain-containing protein [Bacteroidota bacterium]
MPHFHSIALQLEEPQKSALLTQYDSMLKNMERLQHIPAHEQQKLADLMQTTLQQQPEFKEIWEKPASQHHVLQLVHEDSRILNLPWRLGLEGKKGLYLCQGHTDFSQKAPFDQPAALPLKILVMVSSPENQSGGHRLSYEAEEQLILDAFKPLFKHGKVEIDFTDDGSLESLELKLKQNKYHILHFSGHGIFKDGKGYLALEDEVTLKQKQVSGSEFAAAVNRYESHRPDLILLSSCQTGMGGQTEDQFAGVANRLLEAEVPAVIAMSLSILDFVATQFASKFYQELANQKSLGKSFEEAILHARVVEAPYALRKNRIPSQWIIPQLYVNQQIDHLANWDLPFNQLKIKDQKLSVASGKGRTLLEEKEGYLFIGRRRERKQAKQALRSDQQAVLLQGMGGIGKTAMAEHLMSRMLANDPKVHAFIVDEKDKSSLDSLIQQIVTYLKKEHKKRTLTSDLARFDKAADKLNFLIELLLELEEKASPVFLFDNMEFFQSEVGGPIPDAHADIRAALLMLYEEESFPIILTGRYPIQELPHLSIVNLNTVGRTDFYKKSLQLHIKELIQHEAVLPKKPGEESVNFDHMVTLLHQTLGGNYRALEYFDKIYENEKENIQQTLSKLEDFQQQLRENHAPRVLEQLNEGAKDLIFQDLYALLTADEKALLHLLTGFRKPVIELAIQMQRNPSPDLPALFNRLVEFTLVEVHLKTIGVESLTSYYIPPLVKEFLPSYDIPFSHDRAASYYEYAHEHLSSEATEELEEAFFHYVREENVSKVNELGNLLSGFYYQLQIFPLAYHFAITAYQLKESACLASILNRIGLIFKLYGRLKEALIFYQQAHLSYKGQEDKKGEGTTLNNISQIYKVRGDYDTALQYLEKSLHIRQQIGDKKGEGTTLNNISQIYDAKGDYDTALQYLEKSLHIRQQIGDMTGLATSLHNMGALFFEQKKDFKKAMEYLLRAYSIRQQLGSPEAKNTLSWLEDLQTEIGEERFNQFLSSIQSQTS